MMVLPQPRRRAFLSVLVGLSATVTIGGPLWTSSPWLGYLFGPVTMLLVLSLAISAPRTNVPRLQWGIVAGLGFSMLGDFLLMLPRDFFLAGLLAFLVAHVCYLVSFTADCRLPARGGPFLVWAAFGGAILFLLWPKVPAGLHAPVVVYTSVILMMVAQGQGRLLQLRTMNALVLAVGATLFLLSDTLLALNRFGYPLPASRVLVLAPYFTAQWMIAISLSIRGPGRDN